MKRKKEKDEDGSSFLQAKYQEKTFLRTHHILQFGARHNEGIIQKVRMPIVNSSQSLLIGVVIKVSQVYLALKKGKV